MADLIVDAKPMDTVSDESSDVQMTQTTEEGIISLPETVTFSESDLHLTPAPAPVATSTPVPVSVPVPVSTSVSTTTTTSNANGNQSSSAASQQTSAPAIKTKKKKGSCNCCGFAGELLSCQQCLEAFHLFCLDPPLQNFPAGSWTCRRCASANIPPFIPDGSNVLSNIIQGILTSNPEVYNIPPDLEPLPTSAIPPENRTLRKKKTNDAHCYACKQEKLLGDNDYVDCHRCSHSFHLYCLEPMLLSKPIGVWTCPSHPGGHSSANVVHNSYGYTNGHASSSSSSSSDGRNTLQADNIVVDFFPYDQLPADDPNKANMPTNRRVKRPPSRTSNLADREKAEWLLGVARSFQEKNRARQKTSTAKDHLEQLLSMIAETANPLPEESVHQLRDIQHRLLAEALGETQVQTPQTLQTPALVQQSSAQASADPIANITPEGMSAFTPLFVQFLAWQRLMQINQTLKNYKVPLQPSSTSSSSTSSRPPISSSSSTIPLIGGAAAASGASLSAADPDDPSPVSKVRRRRKSKADTDDYNEDFSPKPKRPRTIDPTSDDDDLDATLEDIDYEKGDASAKKIARSALAGASASPAGVLGAKKKKGRGRGRPRTSSSNDDLDDHEGPSPSPSPSPSPALAPPSLTSSFLFAPSLSSPSASLVAPTPSVIPPVSTAQVPQTDIKMAIATVTPSVPRTPLAASSISASSIAPILSNFSAAPVDPRAFVSAPPSAPAPRSSFGLRITDPSVHLNVTATTFPFKIGRCKVKEGEQPIDLNLAKYSEGGDTRKVSHLHCVFSVPEDAPPGHFAIHCKGRNGVVCNGQELRLDESRTLGPDPVILHVGPFVLNVEPLL